MTDCGCVKENFDFTLHSLDSNTLVYQDMSVWMEGDEFSIPDNYNVSILAPSKGEGNDVTLSVNSQTSITSKNLFGSSELTSLPDGIYCFTLENCGTKFQRSKAVLYSLECCLQSFKASANTDKDFDRIRKLELYLDSVRINTELGKTQKALEFYDRAKRELSNLNCNCK